LRAANQSGQDNKIICYIVAWLVALFATNPDGGLWALAWMFPLGLAAFINPHWGNQWGLGSLRGLHRNLSCSRLLLLSLTNPALDALSVRRPNCPAHLQCPGMPGDDPHALKTITGPPYPN